MQSDENTVDTFIPNAHLERKLTALRSMHLLGVFRCAQGGRPSLDAFPSSCS